MSQATTIIVVGDGNFATAPFLHTADAVCLPILARLKDNLPELAAAAFQHGEDWIEVCDADDFDPWETLDWPTVRVMRYR